jgi:hypothetical protein
MDMTTPPVRALSAVGILLHLRPRIARLGEILLLPVHIRPARIEAIRVLQWRIRRFVAWVPTMMLNRIAARKRDSE